MLRIKVPFFIIMLIIPLLTSATSDKEIEEAKNTNEPDISSNQNPTVINEEMIARFKNAEFSDNYITINQLLKNYDIEQLKEITDAHRSTGLDVNNHYEIAEILSNSNEMESVESEKLILQSELDLKARFHK